MNREIKFRVWDNVNYMTTSFNLIDIVQGKVEFTSDCKIIQFTGLQDKNNKDIYEDDWCKALFKTRNEVLEIEGRIMMYDYMWCIHCGDEIYSINRIYDVEVITSIHENPELIK